MIRSHRSTACRSKLVPIKVAYAIDDSIDAASVIRAIEYAIDKNLNVLNMSFGITEYTTAFEEAIDAAQATGLIIVCSAGNGTGNLDLDSGTHRWPQSFDQENIICVMASDYLNTPTGGLGADRKSVV